MLPDRGAQTGRLAVAVTSAEGRTRRYRLDIRTDALRSSSMSFRLRPGQTVQASVSVLPRRRPTSVTALLYRLDRPDKVYRRVTARVPAAGSRRSAGA